MAPSHVSPPGEDASCACASSHAAARWQRADDGSVYGSVQMVLSWLERRAAARACAGL
jgi:hypothetical protein